MRQLRRISTWRTGPQGPQNERGAALVELAITLPILLILLFGIVEAGWAFSQRLEVQHGAREAARLAAVDYGSDEKVTAETCSRMHFTGDEASTKITIKVPAGADIGDVATVEVVAKYSSLTKLLDPLFGSASLHSDLEIRLEQEPRASLGTGTAHTCA